MIQNQAFSDHLVPGPCGSQMTGAGTASILGPTTWIGQYSLAISSTLLEVGKYVEGMFQQIEPRSRNPLSLQQIQTRPDPCKEPLNCFQLSLPPGSSSIKPNENIVQLYRPAKEEWTSQLPNGSSSSLSVQGTAKNLFDMRLDFCFPTAWVKQKCSLGVCGRFRENVSFRCAFSY